MDLQLTNKNVLITGGSKGIGKAILQSFAKEGATISICARNKTTIESTLAEFKNFPKKIHRAQS